MELSQLSPTDDAGPDPESGEPYVRSHYDSPRRSRYIAALLSLGVCALLLLAILSMAALSIQKGEPGSLLTAIKLTPPPKEVLKAHAGAKSKPKATAVPHEVQAAIKLPPHVDIKNPNKVEWPPGFIHMSHADLANSDISKFHTAAPGGNGHENGGGGGHGGDNGPGESSFYNVDWYRKPPKSVFDNYMRPGQSPGRRAEIECRMIENYHVEDCHEVSEEPRGSGMARVMREASWQFLVRPPRLNGKTLLGTRVHITYTFTQLQKVMDADTLPDGPLGDQP